MPSPTPSIAAHLEWRGFVRPTRLGVSALARRGAALNRNDTAGRNPPCRLVATPLAVPRVGSIATAHAARHFQRDASEASG